MERPGIRRPRRGPGRCRTHTYIFPVPGYDVEADGQGSPAACKSPNADVTSIEGDPVAQYDASPNTVTGVCIKSGSNMFGSNQHSGLIEVDGNYGGPAPGSDCYTVAGIGTTIVTVTRTASGSSCQVVGHIDIIIDPATASPSPSPSPTPTPTPTGTPTATPTATPTPTPTPTGTPAGSAETPEPTPTPGELPNGGGPPPAATGGSDSWLALLLLAGGSALVIGGARPIVGLIAAYGRSSNRRRM